MSTVTRIIALVVDTNNLTLYKVDGSTIVIEQGDSRLKPLVELVLPYAERHEPCDVPAEYFQVNSSFAEVEKQANGLVRFFRASKKKLAEIASRFGLNSVPPLEAGVIPETTQEAVAEIIKVSENQAFIVKGEAAVSDEKPVEQLTKGEAAVAEIMQHAVSTKHEDFNDNSNDEDSTIIAVTSDNVVIPGAEVLQGQMVAATKKIGSAAGLTKFFERLASVTRAHTAQDLLKFMEKGELPVAEDGSVLVYKRLRSTGEDGVFVDCHSGKVKQRVGSHVFMDEKLVDPNRHNECSNGLHVARRDYLRSFSGDVTVLAKLAPEDVIAVPHGDSRKLRAKGYHIIARLSSEDARRVCSNQAMADQVLLGNAIAGNHVGIIETVQITQSQGGGVIITPVGEHAEVVLDSSKVGQSIEGMETETSGGELVDGGALALAKASKESAATSALDAVESKEEFFSAEEEAAMNQGVDEEPVKVAEPTPFQAHKAAKKANKKPAAKAKSKTKAKAKPAPVVKKPEAKKAKEAVHETTVAVQGKLTLKQQMSNLMVTFQKATGNSKLEAARAVLDFKKAKKKGWTELGLTDSQVALVTKAAGV